MDSVSEIMQDNSDDLSQFKDNSHKTNTKDSSQQQNKKGKNPNTTKQKKQADNELEKLKNKQQPSPKQKKSNKRVAKLEEISSKLDKIIQLLASSQEEDSGAVASQNNQSEIVEEVEGVFDGQHMIGSDTSKYEVPYKFTDEKNLVEGDLLKLNVKGGGDYKYETVEVVDRKRLVGQVVTSEQKWYVQVESDKYRIRGDFIENKNIDEGDKVVILVPKHGKSNWAAIENVF